MVIGKRDVIWDKPALQSLQAAFKFIKQDSLQNAEMVKNELLNLAQKLSHNPERHPPDKFRKNNDGSYRAFEKLSYRIAFKITDTQVIILRVRHTKQEPLEY